MLAAYCHLRAAHKTGACTCDATQGPRAACTLILTDDAAPGERGSGWGDQVAGVAAELRGCKLRRCETTVDQTPDTRHQTKQHNSDELGAPRF